jgi:hypothetical protein
MLDSYSGRQTKDHEMSRADDHDWRHGALAADKRVKLQKD